MKLKRIAVLDTETTGLPLHHRAPIALQPRVIEFAGLITDGVEILDTFEFICNPGIEIEPVITRITGLTNEELVKHPPFSNFLGDLYAFVHKADAWIAHNVSFDKFMLELEMQRMGLTLEAMGLPRRAICTVEESMPLFGRPMKLEHLYNRLCGDYEQKHRALDDVKLLHEVAGRLGVYEAYQAQGEQA